MKYTVHCPCHDRTPEINTNGDVQVVKVGDEMMCGHCSCIHRVADVEPGELMGVVRLARLSHEELVAAYRELGMTFVAVACPLCGEECTALAQAEPDPAASGLLFCPGCHMPMIVEGDTAREPNAAERAGIIGMALDRISGNSLFPETPFGIDPFAGGPRERGFGGKGR